jgi:protein-disulfide isomerase
MFCELTGKPFVAILIGMDSEHAASGRRGEHSVPLSILVSGVLIAGAIVYAVKGERPSAPSQPSGLPAGVPAVPAPLAGKEVTELRGRDVILGDEKAPVTLIEYGDYQCPFCTRFFKGTEPALRKGDIKNGTVRMVFRAFSFLGAESFDAAEAAECAKDQGKFWAYHDGLYEAEYKDEQKNPAGSENNGNLNRALFTELASQVGLDAEKFAACLDGKIYASQAQKDAAEAQAAGVNSTPTLFINGQKISGAIPYDGSSGALPAGMLPLKDLIQNALKKK